MKIEFSYGGGIEDQRCDREDSYWRDTLRNAGNTLPGTVVRKYDTQAGQAKTE